jgi:hypothetical protein
MKAEWVGLEFGIHHCRCCGDPIVAIEDREGNIFCPDCYEYLGPNHPRVTGKPAHD